MRADTHGAHAPENELSPGSGPYVIRKRTYSGTRDGGLLE